MGMREIVTLNRVLCFLLCLAHVACARCGQEQTNREGRGGFSKAAEKD
jgi:hypothetical protein